MLVILYRFLTDTGQRLLPGCYLVEQVRLEELLRFNQWLFRFRLLLLHRASRIVLLVLQSLLKGVLLKGSLCRSALLLLFDLLQVLLPVELENPLELLWVAKQVFELLWNIPVRDLSLSPGSY